MSRNYPKRLQTGDTVAIVSPASTPQREPLQRAIQRLHDLGLKTKTYGDLYRSHGYLAGTDAERARELMAAFADPEVAAVMPARGGYGISRLLDRLDYQIIADNPKAVEDLTGGNKKTRGFFVGQVMKATKGQANPQVVNELLDEKLGL